MGVGSHSNGYGTVKGSQWGFQHEYGTAKGIYYEINTLLACDRKPFITSSLLHLQPFLYYSPPLSLFFSCQTQGYFFSCTTAWQVLDLGLNVTFLTGLLWSQTLLATKSSFCPVTITSLFRLYPFHIFLIYLFYCKLKVCCGYSSGL